MRRIVITGMGAVTPLGHSVKAMFEAQLAGRSGVAPIVQFNARRFPTQFAAEVKDFDFEKLLPQAGQWAKDAGVNSRFAAAAAQQALTDAGLADNQKVDRTRVRHLSRLRRGCAGFPQPHVGDRSILQARDALSRLAEL